MNLLLELLNEKKCFVEVEPSIKIEKINRSIDLNKNLDKHMKYSDNYEIWDELTNYLFLIIKKKKYSISIFLESFLIWEKAEVRVVS